MKCDDCGADAQYNRERDWFECIECAWTSAQIKPGTHLTDVYPNGFPDDSCVTRNKPAGTRNAP